MADLEKTSPFQFYQFWLNIADESVEEYLLKMTTLQTVEIDVAMELHKRDSKERHGQQLLAREVTTLVHGKEKAEESERISQVLFGDAGISELDSHGAAALRAAAPSFEVHGDDGIVGALVGAQLASSKREARQFLADEAVTLNGEVVSDEGRALGKEDFHNGIALLKRGKRNVCVLVLA